MYLQPDPTHYTPPSGAEQQRFDFAEYARRYFYDKSMFTHKFSRIPLLRPLIDDDWSPLGM